MKGVSRLQKPSAPTSKRQREVLSRVSCPQTLALFYFPAERNYDDVTCPFVAMDEDLDLDKYHAALLEFDGVAPGIEMWMKSYQLDGFLMRRFAKLKSDKAIRNLSRLWMKEEECE